MDELTRNLIVFIVSVAAVIACYIMMKRTERLTAQIREIFEADAKRAIEERERLRKFYEKAVLEGEINGLEQAEELARNLLEQWKSESFRLLDEGEEDDGLFEKSEGAEIIADEIKKIIKTKKP